jgi:hypothetical protein
MIFFKIYSITWVQQWYEGTKVTQGSGLYAVAEIYQNKVPPPSRMTMNSKIDIILKQKNADGDDK